jgi:hypothetical protein
MSINAFNKRARINVSVLISGAGQFSPFSGEFGIPINWTIEGRVLQGDFVDELTVKEETCRVPYGSDKMFQEFGIFPGSTGGTSGNIPIGQLPVIAPSLVEDENRGLWIVNTSPILAPGGYAGETLVQRGYYTVAQPEDAGIDDPINIDPPIDGLSRVYPGDQVTTVGTGANTQWRVVSQQRFPKPDRTFFWTPNSAPHLESGGLADGELVLPGTVMIPTTDFFIEDSADYIDGMFAFIAGSGLMFNGQTWSSLVAAPYVYEPENDPRELWYNIGYGGTGRYDTLLEAQHLQKPFVYGNIPVDDASTPTYDYTPEDQPTQSEALIFRWGNPLNGVANNMVARPLLYDFGDAWSRFHRNTRDWLTQRFPGINGAPFSLSTTGEGGQDVKTIQLEVDRFEDGNETVIQQTYTDPEGNTLTNSFTITLSATVSII